MQRSSRNLQKIVELLEKALAGRLLMTTDEAIEYGIVVKEELEDGSPVDDVHLPGASVAEQRMLWLDSGSLLVVRDLDCPEGLSPALDDLWSEVDAEQRGQHGQCLWVTGTGCSNVTGERIDFLHAIVHREHCCCEIVLYSDETRRELALSLGDTDDIHFEEERSEAERIVEALRAA